MTASLYVANASPLIIFERLGKFALLYDLMTHLIVPSAVRREVFGSDPLPEWIEERALTQPLAAHIIAARIGLGEREAIALALELKADLLVIDDLTARRLAASLGIQVIGSLGLLVKAKDRGLIPAVRPLMEAMRRAEFHISDRLWTGILATAGELD